MWTYIVFVLIVIAAWVLWRTSRAAPATADPPETVNVREPVPVEPQRRRGYRGAG